MVEAKTKEETRKIGDWDMRVEVWKRQAKGDKISAIHRHFQIHAGEKGYPKYPPDRDTIRNVCKLLFKLLPEQIRLLPQEIQAIACEHKPGLKEKLESLQSGKIPEAVPKELIPKIEELAKRLEWLIRVPKPKRPLLTEEELEGNVCFSLGVARTLNTPWWCTDPFIHVYLMLNADQAALFNHLVSLPASQSFKIHYGKWVTKTNNYLDLVRADKGKIEAAYQEAECLMHKAHDELWKAVDALRWPS